MWKHLKAKHKDEHNGLKGIRKDEDGPIPRFVAGGTLHFDPTVFRQQIAAWFCTSNVSFNECKSDFLMAWIRTANPEGRLPHPAVL